MDVCQIACRWGPLLANPTHVYLRLASLWPEYFSRPRSQVPSSHAGVSTHAGEPKALRVGTMASTGIVGLVSDSSWEWSVSRFAMHLQLPDVRGRRPKSPSDMGANLCRAFFVGVNLLAN